MANLLSEKELFLIFVYSNKAFKKEIKRQEAIDYLKQNIETHSPDSLAMYIDNYRYLRTGTPYGRNMGKQILEFFLEQINHNFGINELNIAIRSLYYHIIKYYQQTGKKQTSDLIVGRKIAEKYNLSFNFDSNIFNINKTSELEAEQKYINDVNIHASEIGQEKHFEKFPKVKREINQSVYDRDIKTAIKALTNADFCCEIDKEHATFIRKSNNKPYTEPHHLIPLSFQEEFEFSLDVENNIVSLCSNCHNKLHYGKNIEKDLLKLYQERKSLLKQVGIYITFEDLLKFYK